MGINIRDLVIVLPGIMGSVLERENTEVWGLSGRAFSTYLFSGGKSISDLILSADDDLDADYAPDGVRATRLVSDLQILPGFWKVDGYDRLIRFLLENLNVADGANLLQFPYDWRRDNRASAKRLARLIDRELHRWRRESGHSDAKVVLLAHSMGGLVARYYTEVLGGWLNCRALITFGTPFRGSVKALNYILNGHTIGWTDVSPMLRSLPSTYQLLPTYPCIEMGGGAVIRPTELGDGGQLDLTRAKAGRAFHDEINAALQSNVLRSDYQSSYRLQPVIGIEQETLQSVRYSAGAFDPTEGLSTNIDTQLSYGDGTVPLASAIPLELSGNWALPFYAETHACIQNNVQVLDALREWLRQSQVKRLANLKGPSESAESPITSPLPRPFIRLVVADQYSDNESIDIVADVHAEAEPKSVTAIISSNDAQEYPRQINLQRRDSRWQGRMPSSPPGRYRIKVRCDGPQDLMPPSVSDVFQVAPTGH
jgi:pimeloyl-ACP methyl ester carboxylesterase